MTPPRRLIWTLDRQLVSRTFVLPPRLGRAAIEILATFDRPPGGVDVRDGSVNGMKARQIIPRGASPGPRIVWIHGGAFSINSPRVYTALAGHLAHEARSSVVMPSYRLAPEHPFPAAVEDSLAAYRAIASEAGPLVLGGDSAGGNLALNIAIALRDSGQELPAGLLLLSPWVDLTMSGESLGSNDGKDAILRRSDIEQKARAYAAGADPSDPRISPRFADLAVLPPTFIQCGSEELFLSEGVDLAERMRAAGTPVELDIVAGGWHDYAAHAGMLPDAAEALARMARFAKPLLA